jgi:hypothetical protein
MQKTAQGLEFGCGGAGIASIDERPENQSLPMKGKMHFPSSAADRYKAGRHF